MTTAPDPADDFWRDRKPEDTNFAGSPSPQSPQGAGERLKAMAVDCRNAAKEYDDMAGKGRRISAETVASAYRRIASAIEEIALPPTDGPRGEEIEDWQHVRNALATLSDPLLIKVEGHLTGVTRALAVINAMREIAATAALHLPALHHPATDPVQRGEADFFRCNCPHEVRSGCSEPRCPHYTPPRASEAENMDAVRHAFRAADNIDWQHLDQFIPHSGHGQFWRAVFQEVRAALASEQNR